MVLGFVAMGLMLTGCALIWAGIDDLEPPLEPESDEKKDLLVFCFSSMHKQKQTNKLKQTNKRICAATCTFHEM